MATHVLTLRGRAGCPQDPPLRDSGVPPELQDARFAAGFDATTLFYDCVRLAHRPGVLVTAPAFRNLWPQFRDGLRVDGRPVRGLRRRAAGRSEQVLLRAGPEAEIAMAGPDGPEPLPVRASVSPDFAGRRVLTAISRNNPLEWIAEWATYHARVHGADAAVLFDNASTDYAPEEVAATLAAVPGMAAVAVVVAPFRYGLKIEQGGQVYRLQFLQTAMLNLLRADFAARARSVLSVDIDELVLAPRGGSVFAAAERAASGAVALRGAWVYPERESDIPCAQSRHGWRAVPDRTCQPKWCARPDGPLSRWGGWNVHAVGGGLRRFMAAAPAFALAHCAGTTTAWKPHSHRFGLPDSLAADPALAAATALARP